MSDGLWLDDMAVGQRYETDSYEVTEQEIIAFARQYDPQPFHVDPEAAKDTFFGGLAASGWHTAGITMRLFVTSGPQLSAGSVGAGVELRWPTPTRPGDVLRVVVDVDSVRPSRTKPDRGIVTLSYRTLNQHDEVRQETTATVVMFARPDGQA